MSMRIILVPLLVLAATACGTQSSPPDQSSTADLQPNEPTGARAPAEQPLLQSTQKVTALAVGEQPAHAPMTKVLLANPEGEPILAHKPAMAAVLEVREGSECGKTNAAGQLLSCQAGTFCASAAPGSRATCVKAPTAPNWGG